MTERKHPFCVGHDDDPKTVEEAIRGLRRMAAYGKLAERALRSLRTHGRYDGRVPVAMQRVWSRHIGNVYAIEEKVFPSFLDVSRADFPEYGRFELEFGKISQGEHGGTLVPEIELILHSQCSRGFPFDWERGAVKFGKARLKADGQTMFVYIGHNMPIQKIYASAKTPKGQASHKFIADALVEKLIQFDRDDEVRQKFLSLRNALPYWLLEDGHITRICQEILSNARVAEVMKV